MTIRGYLSWVKTLHCTSSAEGRRQRSFRCTFPNDQCTYPQKTERENLLPDEHPGLCSQQTKLNQLLEGSLKIQGGQSWELDAKVDRGYRFNMNFISKDWRTRGITIFNNIEKRTVVCIQVFYSSGVLPIQSSKYYFYPWRQNSSLSDKNAPARQGNRRRSQIDTLTGTSHKPDHKEHEGTCLMLVPSCQISSTNYRRNLLITIQQST